MEKETKEIDKELEQEKRVYELIKVCNSGDKPNPKAREELQELLRESQVAKAVMENQEALYSVALKNRIENFKSSDAFKEVLKSKCRQLREQLGYDTANKLEKLAIEQIILCWVNYHLTKISHAGILAGSHNKDTGIYWEKRLSMANRRYNQALNTLSKMRKMNLILQVNQAANQIVKNG